MVESASITPRINKERAGGVAAGGAAATPSRQASETNELCGYDVDSGREPELLEHSLAVFPGKPEFTHVSQTKPSNHGSDCLDVLLIEIAFLNRILRPINQIAKRLLVPQVGDELISHGFLGDLHGDTLHLPVPRIQWKFFVGGPEFAGVVVNLLPEAHGGLGSIHLLEVNRLPAGFALYFQTIAPAAAS